MTSDLRTCKNCQSELIGRYCHICGQKEITRRLSIREILREIPEKVFSMERGLWLTFLSLWSRPGQVCLDYVQGKRQPYVNPVSYFLIGASLQLVSLWFSAPILRQSVHDSIQAANQKPEQAKMFERMDSMIGGDTATEMANVYLTVIAQAYTYLAFFAFACPLAVLLWVFHRRANYRFAEIIVFTLYVVAHCLVVTAFTTPIFVRFGNVMQLLTAQGLYIGIIIWAHHKFFPPGIGRRLLTLLAMLMAMLCFFGAIMVLFGVSWAAYLVAIRLQNS